MATKTREISDFLVEGGADLAIVGEPHIKPGTLYPAMRHFREITNNSGSSAIGDMTTNAGIASAFNGMKYSHWNASARKDPSANAFIGKDWGSGNSNIVTRFKIWAPYNYPLAGNTAGKYMKLQGSNDNSSWTDLYEDPEVLDNYTILDVSTGITITTAYRYHRIFFEGDGNGGAVAELEFYTEDNPGRVYLADNETAHSGAYGTAQSDGKKYYYTDVEGSKPIKDPRIGAHFGSQRHNCGSLQTLEEETSYHSMTGRMDGHADNDRVASIDGREWCKAVGDVGLNYGGWGTALEMKSKSTFIEIVGYFNDANINIYAEANRTMRWSLDGAAENATNKPTSPLNETPHSSRFIDAGSLINLGLNTTVGIHTLKLRVSGSSDIPFYSFELIVNDTGSTARKKQINIPAQNVISYGKKFSIGSDTLTDAVHKHYDPFNGFSAGSNATTLGTFIDTATSLGMDNWKAGTSNYYKPFNGGRVVRWVASDGTIKTSVTMMPPNAQNIGEDAVDAYSNAEVQAGTNNHAITFDTTTIANATPLFELAKSFHWREFGNGAANATGGLGTSSTYADFSMLTTNADYVAYTMDDGLTSMQGEANGDHLNAGDWYAGGGNSVWITFIGTGIGFQDDKIGSSAEIANGTYAQNLAYGSHILRLERSSPYDVWVDGFHISTAALVSGDFIGGKFINFHQPKMPPVPEDACILADYMLMADFVLQNGHNAAHDTKCSKGVRFQSHSRDIFYDDQSGFSANIYDDGAFPGMGFRASSNASSGQTANKYSIPAFGTTFIAEGFDGDDRNDCFIDDSDVAQDTNSTNNNVHGDIVTPNSAVELGLHKFAVHGISGGASSPYLSRIGFHIVTPIHTSSHYQAFETPYLHELVGGDRNMEQHNLIVTPDGKTWDEVTRDTSYIGNMVVSITTNTTHADGAIVIFDEIRGDIGTYRGLGTKDWTIANNRLVCLKDGQYEAIIVCNEDDTGYTTILLNGTNQVHGYQAAGEVKNKSYSYSFIAKRGDYLQLKGHYGHDTNLFNNFQIKRL